MNQLLQGRIKVQIDLIVASEDGRLGLTELETSASLINLGFHAEIENHEHLPLNLIAHPRTHLVVGEEVSLVPVNHDIKPFKVFSITSVSQLFYDLLGRLLYLENFLQVGDGLRLFCEYLFDLLESLLLLFFLRHDL